MGQAHAFVSKSHSDKKEAEMANKDYSLLNKTLIITDMYETDRDPMVLGGVAIRAEDLEEFIEAVEEIAVNRFGGASFSELLDNDLADDTTRASSARHDREQIDAMFAEVKRILGRDEDLQIRQGRGLTAPFVCSRD